MSFIVSSSGATSPATPFNNFYHPLEVQQIPTGFDLNHATTNITKKFYMSSNIFVSDKNFIKFVLSYFR